MKLHTYDSYEQYKQVQTEGNIRKLTRCRGIYEPAVQFYASLIKEATPNPKFGLCHGTRAGWEQKWFAQYTGAHVLGTEISPTASMFPNTVQWDFHELKPEWDSVCDFVYSNAWDHCMDPDKAFTAWMREIRPGGLLLLEHSNGHLPKWVTALDPFGIEVEGLTAMLNEIGTREDCKVMAVIRDFPFEVPKYLTNLKLVVVGRG